jgi:murein L,D-transpeptidase YafK
LKRSCWSKVAARTHRRGLFACLALGAFVINTSTADAVSIELKDAAPKRVENQRLHAAGEVTLPGTPNTAAFLERLAAAGQKIGNPVFIRIFKAEAELEVWMQKDKDGPYERFATYPVCNWSGTLGPKLTEGDKQTPEGFYTITRRQLHRIGRWPRSLNLGFPNVYDRSLARTGSYILVHGGCSSVGCFAMTNPIIREIYRLTRTAITKGQSHVPIHVFPFRMSVVNLNKHATNEWHGFWQNLKEGFDAFEESRVPPRVRVCDGRYHFDRIDPGGGGRSEPFNTVRRYGRRSAGLGRILQSCAQPPAAESDKLQDAKAGVENSGKRRSGASQQRVRNLSGRHAGSGTRRGRKREAATRSAHAPTHAGPSSGAIISVQMQPEPR